MPYPFFNTDSQPETKDHTKVGKVNPPKVYRSSALWALSVDSSQSVTYAHKYLAQPYASPLGVALASSRRSTSLKVGRACGSVAQQSRASAAMWAGHAGCAVRAQCIRS